jgi:hypothetical protein
MFTVRVAGVVPVVGVTASQAPPEAVFAVAVKLEGLPPVTDSARVCGVGFEPPIWKFTVPSDDGVTEIVGEFVTVNVTPMTCGLAAPGEVSVICPV